MRRFDGFAIVTLELVSYGGLMAVLEMRLS